MKMKFNAEIKGTKVNCEVEYGIEEMKEGYALFRTVLKDIPAMLDEVKAGFDRFTEIDNEYKENTAKKVIEEITKKVAVETLKSVAEEKVAEDDYDVEDETEYELSNKVIANMNAQAKNISSMLDDLVKRATEYAEENK